MRKDSHPVHRALSPDQSPLIPEFLGQGAKAHGFRGSVRTCGRIAKVIEEEFGVAYDRGHISRLLRQLRWTPQMPIRRGAQRDEKAVDQWRAGTWPRLLTDARTEHGPLFSWTKRLLPAAVGREDLCARGPHAGVAGEADARPPVIPLLVPARLGDTDFSQTAHLDGWDDQPDVTFLFGIDATANLRLRAELLDQSAYQKLSRPRAAGNCGKGCPQPYLARHLNVDQQSAARAAARADSL